MYEQFYGLTGRPFDLTPNPHFLLLTATHREALNTLDYGIRARKGVTLLLGDAGTGKTTLIRAMLAERWRVPIGPRDLYVYVNNPRLTAEQFFETIAEQFALGQQAASTKARFLRELEATLRTRDHAGLCTTLIVDEAQSLSNDLLEELRLLANIETDTHKLLQLVLAGQPELAERLNEGTLRQFKQRIALRCSLTALTLEETAAYIAGRLRLAGASGAPIFSREAVVATHLASGGIPRTISVICDNALLAGFAADENPIAPTTVEQVCADLDIGHLPVPRPASQIATVAHTSPEPAYAQEPRQQRSMLRVSRHTSRHVISLFGWQRQ